MLWIWLLFVKPTSQCKPCKHQMKSPGLGLCLFRVWRPLRQSCVVTEHIYSPKTLVNRSFSLDVIALHCRLSLLELGHASFYLIIMSHGNHTDKLNKRSVSSHFGEGQVIANTAAERKSDSAPRGCMRSKGVSLWNLELLFEIAWCPTRLICTSLLSQHVGNGAFPFAESRRLFGPGRPCAKISQREKHGH